MSSFTWREWLVLGVDLLYVLIVLFLADRADTKRRKKLTRKEVGG